MGLWDTTTSLWILALPLSICVSSGNSLNLSGPPFTQVNNKGSFEGVGRSQGEKHLRYLQGAQQSKHLIATCCSQQAQLVVGL